MKEMPCIRRTRGDVWRKLEGAPFKGVFSGGPLDGELMRTGLWSLLFGAFIRLRKQPGKPRRVAVYKWTDKKKRGRDVWRFVRYERAKTKGES